MDAIADIVNRLDRICKKNDIPFNGIEKAILIRWLKKNEAERMFELFGLLRTDEEDERWLPKTKRLGYSKD